MNVPKDSNASSPLSHLIEWADEFVHSKQRPPVVEIDVVKKRPPTLHKSKNRKQWGPLGSSDRSNWSSGRSVASSITFPEDSVDIHGKLRAVGREAQMDNKPDKPQRQGSCGGGSVASSTESEDDLNDQIRDSPPNQPRRRTSFASMASSIAATTMSIRSSISNLKSEGKAFRARAISLSSLSPPFISEAEVGINMVDLKGKASKFRRIANVKDRRYAMRTFRSCFIGCEAVDEMIKTGLAENREEAVLLGRDMIKHLNLFLPITKGNAFKDNTMLYRFTDNANSDTHADQPWFQFHWARTTEERSPIAHEDHRRISPLDRPC